MPDHQVAVPLVLGWQPTTRAASRSNHTSARRSARSSAELRAAHPHTPLLAVSALGSAGELIAARAALALGVPVVACLAQPPDRGGDSPLRAAVAACADVRVADESFQAHAPFAAEAQVAHFKRPAHRFRGAAGAGFRAWRPS